MACEQHIADAFIPREVAVDNKTCEMVRLILDGSLPNRHPTLEVVPSLPRLVGNSGLTLIET
jgi:hypothetical protein